MEVKLGTAALLFVFKRYTVMQSVLELVAPIRLHI